MANIFNSVFVNTAHEINEKIPQTRKSPLDYLSFTNTFSFFIAAVTPEEIQITINSMKNGKAIGPIAFQFICLKY